MVVAGFKDIQPVPTSSDLLDIVLSRTQRKTPTVIHKGYAINRIRSFYLRKVRFTHQTFDERLTAILQDFPRLDDIHPFYADLMNVLYDKDHYKLALSQVSTCKHLIESVAKEYERMLKYGDSLYRCKQLKRAALGRMATLVKRQKDALSYLEQVRQHLSRLPSIDPTGRTLLLCGYPNVGKSSFMNKVTRADVDVQPYAFTTRSLFVGHFDYKYLRWQVIDTPGILDHPLAERNTIEMQSITALAHIRAAILYFMDLSESCGHSLAEQLSLFSSIKPLFSNKPVLIIANKADLVRSEQLEAESAAQLQGLLDQGIPILPVSCLTEEGLMDARNEACERLMAIRVEAKLNASGGQRLNDVLNRLHVSQPQSRDQVVRPPCVPASVLAKREKVAKQLAKDIEVENGGAGVYNVDLKASYLLKDQEWRHDPIPEILNGHNIADFFDPDIEERLARLEAEEEGLDYTPAYVDDPELRKAYGMVLEGKALKRMEHHAKTDTNRRVLHVQRIRKRSRNDTDVDMEVDEPEEEPKDPKRAAIEAVSEQKKRMAQKKMNLHARRGEADREVTVAKPRHLFSGKRKNGTHNRR